MYEYYYIETIVLMHAVVYTKCAPV